MNRVRMAITLVAALTLAVVPLAAAASGSGEMRYRDVVTDARRPNMPDVALAKWADVLKGSRAVVRHDQGGQWIRVKVWARRDFPIPKRVLTRHVSYSSMQLHVYVDVTKDRATDVYLDFAITAVGRHLSRSCSVDESEYGERLSKCRVDTTRDGALVLRARTPVPIRKDGRWQIVSMVEWTPRDHPRNTRFIFPFDRAPNCVWFCG